MKTADAEPQDDRPSSAPVEDDGSVRASFTRLVDTGREMAAAELSWAKLKAGLIANCLRTGFILGLLALICLVMGVMILIVAAIIALAPALGWLGATLAVGILSLVMAILLALGARWSVMRLFADEAR